MTGVRMRPGDGGTRSKTVVISAGFHKTHETVAASEASTRDLLELCITGAYPTRRLQRAARLLGVAGKGRVARLLDRDEGLPPSRVVSLLAPELLYECARAAAHGPGGTRRSSALIAKSLRLYGHRAGAALAGVGRGARVYHYRAGFGQASVRRAKELGMFALCDRSLVHPALLQPLIANRGATSDPLPTWRTLNDPIEVAVVADLDAADAVLVNSQFVKDTFVAMGWSEDRVHVVYLGVDDKFLRGATGAPRAVDEGRLRLLFAGSFEARKGAEVLIEALNTLHEVDWELSLAGPIPPEIQKAYGHFLEDPRVKPLGSLRRRELGELMAKIPVFVFPSFAEGSARVVFEALASGCYVITTPNAGSIVDDTVHGAVVPPGEVGPLRDAIVYADRNRARVAETGNSNARLIGTRYRQSDYGDALAALYGALVAGRHRD